MIKEKKGLRYIVDSMINCFTPEAIKWVSGVFFSKHLYLALGFFPLFFYLLNNGVVPAGLGFSDVFLIGLSAYYVAFLLFVVLYVSFFIILVPAFAITHFWGLLINNWFFCKWFLSKSYSGLRKVLVFVFLLFLLIILVRYNEFFSNFIGRFFWSSFEELIVFRFVLLIVVLGSCLVWFMNRLISISESRRQGSDDVIGKNSVVVFFIFVPFLFFVLIPDLIFKDLPIFITKKTGVAGNGVSIVIDKSYATDSVFLRLHEDGLNGCADESGIIINNLDVVWKGLGSLVYVKKPEDKEPVALPAAAIKYSYAQPDKYFVCKLYVGRFFETGSVKNTIEMSEVLEYSNQFKKSVNLIDEVEVHWTADPSEIKKSDNYTLSGKRASAVASVVINAICQSDDKCIKKIKIKTKGLGPRNDYQGCKDWPVKNTLPECLSNNRGGIIKISMKKEKIK